jgi:hypothetical protein
VHTRQIVMARRPSGALEEDDLRTKTVALPEQRPGHVLLRNVLVSVAPAARAVMQGPTYRPQLQPGEPVPASVLGEVVSGPPGGPRPGTVVGASAAWQEFSSVPLTDAWPLQRVGRLPHHLGPLGRDGLTAFSGVRDVGEVREGQTVLVSGAAGGVGYLAAQLARAAERGWSAPPARPRRRRPDLASDTVSDTLLDTLSDTSYRRGSEAGTSGLPPRRRTPMSTTTRPTVLLVHGAWHGPWAFDAFQPVLHAQGWPTRVVALPSSATIDPGSTGAGVHEDAAAVRSALQDIDGPVVVLAHSYGGIPVSQAIADAPDVVHVVYLAAYQLDVGESMFSAHGVPLPASPAGLVPLAGEPRAMFYADVPTDLADRAISRLGTQSLRSCVEPLTAAGWHRVPSTYVVCEQDGALPVELQERFALRSGDVRRLPSGHSPFLSMPTRLARLLEDATSAVSAS